MHSHLILVVLQHLPRIHQQPNRDIAFLWMGVCEEVTDDTANQRWMNYLKFLVLTDISMTHFRDLTQCHQEDPYSLQ